MNDVSPLVEAQQRFANAVPFRSLEAERCQLAAALGRVLYSDLSAPFDSPPYSRAIAEGFLVHTTDTSSASDNSPVTFKAVGTVFPGDEQCPDFGKGKAIRVVTGSLVPDGDYSIVRMWDCETNGERFTIKRPFAPRFFIEDHGCDYQEGAVVLTAGMVLGPAEIGVIASFGMNAVEAIRQPRVRLFSSGDEVIPHTTTMRPGAIFDCNSPMLSAAVTASGGVPSFAGIMNDDFDAFVAMAKEALAEFDMILISGGTAVGGRDFIADLVSEVGELVVNGVPMKSGKPLIMGMASGKPIVCVAGHPPEALRGFRLFGAPAIDRLTGRAGELPRDE